MNALTAYITAKDAERTKFYCPCCKDRLDADDMDLANEWRHSEAMRARYGAACCKGCAHSHILTDDGALVSSAAQVFLGFDGIYSSAEALQDARDAADEDDAHQCMCGGWL